ncbi:hypothetical protein L228DRAFT_129225 [Xylona heveae TC161]|uniref:Uncharacterized protein n=1 Tax=Xylona heveae (strain CBS 132557 / TC161) TaxID=1328760 RepID=A0A165GTT2_XYLHT|nr:hypothetical protein L228DRAFT_129225 [Xylona heveae TC161]KZF22589.1 hypothetical protein L228DRAFT_129225 [Xylona heveae TC161]
MGHYHKYSHRIVSKLQLISKFTFTHAFSKLVVIAYIPPIFFFFFFWFSSIWIPPVDFLFEPLIQICVNKGISQ